MTTQNNNLREKAKFIARKVMAETLVQGGDDSTLDITAGNIDHFTNYGIIVAETSDAIEALFNSEALALLDRLGENIWNDEEKAQRALTGNTKTLSPEYANMSGRMVGLQRARDIVEAEKRRYAGE